MNVNDTRPNCLLVATETRLFQPQAEDILTDEDLLDLFRIVKQVLRKKPDSDKLAKLLFCVSYALGDHVKFFKPLHEDKILFRDDATTNITINAVRLPNNSSCSQTNTSDLSITSDDTSTDPFTVRPYTNFRPLYPASSSSPAIPIHSSFERSHTTSLPQSEVLMEPKQRGFYYQDGRIAREPVLLQRYAEQGILTQASLMRKRKRHSTDASVPYEINPLPQPTKKPKIPHRHGEFEHRRDDIINRMRSITMQDLEQKAQRMPVDFALVIERSPAPETFPGSMEELSKEQAADYLEPALRILTSHSNMKPHLDNGMNQNGIYYNSDYFRLYMAFEQFQKTFAHLFPNDVVKIPEDDFNLDGMERDKDRERNANMKAYRNWIEPLLTETNWAAFRRNIVVGERMMQLTKVVGQGVLLMTKELSGSKLHLTFTNNEWDEFITGLSSGKWDQTIKWDSTSTSSTSRLVSELRQKFITDYWFHPDGTMVSSKDRKSLYRSSSINHISSSPHHSGTDDKKGLINNATSGDFYKVDTNLFGDI
ncbi:uncharacterized protein BX664DRAFT_303686 [Halteromyces radiatus]|uniref:uncharacterized protein n=1 Tax=Halteromyces radiatus TaxID=101107 RepID=UPI00221F6003|nr:uncharacterized protein BX664DRAFT_303686 [Halteromyces radiatus]KAI8078838.1 hypothetical protein BX664DRAFT_303686 [Halteromyces radiatus]